MREIAWDTRSAAEEMITVKATREGLPGQRTSSGYVIDAVVAFVALPSIKALHKFVRIINPANHHTSIAQVLDVGPWNTNDDAYVFQHATYPGLPSQITIPEVRPAAEAGKSVSAHGTNGAGIDLSGFVWNALGMVDNSNVIWEFIN